MKKFNKFLAVLLPVITIICILILWSIGADAVDSKYILPSVMDTVEAMFVLFKTSKFYVAFSLTLLRSLIAFIVSFFIASIFAYFANKSKKIESVVLTVVSILRALPTIAIVLLLVLWTDEQVAPIIVTMLVVLPTAYTNIKNAFDSVDKTTTEAGKVDGASSKQILFKIQLPQITPALLSSIGSGISLNFKLMVAAEVLSATIKSLGNLLNNAKNSIDGIASMLAMVLITIIFGILIEFLFNKIASKLGDWK